MMLPHRGVRIAEEMVVVLIEEEDQKADRQNGGGDRPPEEGVDLVPTRLKGDAPVDEVVVEAGREVDLLE